VTTPLQRFVDEDLLRRLVAVCAAARAHARDMRDAYQTTTDVRYANGCKLMVEHYQRQSIEADSCCRELTELLADGVNVQ